MSELYAVRVVYLDHQWVTVEEIVIVEATRQEEAGIKAVACVARRVGVAMGSAYAQPYAQQIWRLVTDG